MIRFINPTDVDLEKFNILIKDSINAKHLTNYGPNERKLVAFLEEKIGYPVATCCNAGVALDILATMFPTDYLPSFTFPATNTPFKNKNITYIEPVSTGEKIGRSKHRWTTVPFGDFRTGLAFNCADVVDAAACVTPNFEVVKEWLILEAQAVVISLHATKLWPACEGAFVAFLNAEIRDQFKSKTNWGIEINANESRKSSGGTNGKISELNAAFALASYDNFVREFNKRIPFVDDLITICKQKKFDFIPSAQSFWIAPEQHFSKTIAHFKKFEIETRNYYWDTEFTPEKYLTKKGVCLPVWPKDDHSRSQIKTALIALEPSGVLNE